MSLETVSGCEDMTSESDTTPEGQTIAKFAEGDPENPRAWPAWRKWTIVASVGLIDLTVLV